MLDRGAHSEASGFFPVNSRIKWLLCSTQVHFDCAGSHKVCVARHFPCIFPHKVALVTCPSAFRLRRLAQVCVAVLGRGVLLVICIRWLVQVHVDCAGSHDVCVAVLGRSVFFLNFCIRLLLYALVTCPSAFRQRCAGSHKTCGSLLGRGIFPVNPSAFRLRRLAQTVAAVL